MFNSSLNTAIILLAAGNSSRMGRPKQLLDFEGKPLVRHAAEVALASGCGPVIVVAGAHETAIRRALTGVAVEIVPNARWPEGMGTSIQCGLRAIGGRIVNGAILALADQPFVSAKFLKGLAEKHQATGKPIVSARYSDTVGVPVFFARDAFPMLMALKADQGCKGIIAGNKSLALLVDCPEAAIDVDTPEDYAALTGRSVLN